ncbi:MAG: extracellular solute-binding protein [Elusimicrobiota bacterium]|nr:extracellular solute-binding protein [Elusimicrobiota bacterium]
MLNVYTAVPLETAEEIIAEFEKENPGLKGKIAIADPSRSGSSRYMTCCLLLNKKFGWGYFVKLYRNKCKLAQSNTALIKQIAAGEIYMGITLDYNVRKLLLDSPDAPVSCVFPAGGVVSMVSPIGLCEGCAHEDQAKRFINWVLSVKGQGFMSKKMGIMPLRDDVPLPEGVPSPEDFKILSCSPVWIFKNSVACGRIFNDIFQGKPLPEINTALAGGRGEYKREGNAK